MWTKFQFILCVIMVSTGSINTITAKGADRREAICFDNKKRRFNHPYLQSLFMFIGEMALLLVYKLAYYIYEKKGMDVQQSVLTRGNRDFKLWILLVPAWCDMIGTTIMLLGLVLTYASSYQMFRGSLIVFTGLLSVIFLKNKLKWKAWLGIFIVMCGLAIVGVADYIIGGKDKSGYTVGNVILGDALIVFGQLVVSIQMVYEEKFVKGLDINACQAIGWEGVFGFITLSILLIPIYFIHAGGFSENSRQVVEDIPEAFYQMWNDYIIILCMTVYLASICFYNFSGISITKELSATTRTVLDTMRTFFIYLVSLFLFNQQFHWLQVLGFMALFTGMCLHNNITADWLINKCKKHKEDEPTDAEGAVPSKQLVKVE